MTKLHLLDEGYTSEIDTLDENSWCETLKEFDDASIYQTWSYAEVLCGRRNMNHMVLRKNGAIVAVAQVRIAKLPLINVGVAYVGWGPLWRRRGTAADPETFRQAIRALRNEFSSKRGLVLRLSPLLYEDDAQYFSTILAGEGFSLVSAEPRGRTILMDLRPPLEVLRDGMNPHWKRQLKLAERNRLEIVEGSDDKLFTAFIQIYKEMVSRKKFVEGNDVTQFRLMQPKLPEDMRCKVMLCKSPAGVCAGLVSSAIGNTALYLFGATSNLGMKSNGSYLLHWHLVQALKKDGRAIYNLNGINPTKNQGTYSFKRDLAGNNGKDVHFLGRFDSSVNLFSDWCLHLGDTARNFHRTLRAYARTASRPTSLTRNPVPSSKPTHSRSSAAPL